MLLLIGHFSYLFIFFLRNYIKNYSKVRLWLVFGTVALVPLLTALRLV